MYLRQPSGKIVELMEEGVREGKLDQFFLGKQAFHLAAQRWSYAEVVVDPHEPARFEVTAHGRQLARRELDVSMTTGEEERVLEEVGAARLGHRFALARDRNVGALL